MQSYIMDSKTKIYDALPKIITERSSDLINLQSVKVDAESSKQQLRDLLETYVPKCDKDDVDNEVRKYFLLTDKKARRRPHKSLRKKNIPGRAPHRGKKRLTGRERRELGLHKVDRSNKTFEMFLPINDIWKKYAEALLGITHFMESGWTGGDRDTKTEAVQNRVRKIDYFGCFMRVTKSRCSEYIGIQGIVIRETKNTFMMICPNDKVKIIPKLHSEFSFVVGKVGFSVLGNHLHQRSAERAKHNFKKLSLWL
ncbi:ribonuclease P protein subunit p29 isoform X2 [Cherax quadricarinatus]|uniref:ribonuclease P protein subunit p29 isoform X2 n=1 Tax=Cherax quadricarinatus TaxID=27406 RepID=UPI0023792554|nr:ribonuclease P protein subunit p29-like isoform X1 [Cherax quadricarinatus]XP_053635291.1 ribonuclease P protein subunit p29-like isoform X1 [Cherax quadricarinatus]XP_053635292.1 ribonuclease P protein subunit p29-like isoform X1 [Cherax quadricarinatus]